MATGEAPDTEAGAGYDATSADTGTSTTSNSNTTGMALTGLGGLTSAFGTYMSAQYNKKVARYNASLARMQAQQAAQAGQFAVNRLDVRERQIEGQQSAMAGAGNTLAHSGSNAQMTNTSRANTAVDQYLIELNAGREAFGYQAKAAADTQAGKMSEMTGNTGATSILMDTAAQEFLESDPNYQGYRGRGLTFNGR